MAIIEAPSSNGLNIAYRPSIGRAVYYKMHDPYNPRYYRDGIKLSDIKWVEYGAWTYVPKAVMAYIRSEIRCSPGIEWHTGGGVSPNAYYYLALDSSFYCSKIIPRGNYCYYNYATGTEPSDTEKLRYPNYEVFEMLADKVYNQIGIHVMNDKFRQFARSQDDIGDIQYDMPPDEIIESWEYKDEEYERQLEEIVKLFYGKSVTGFSIFGYINATQAMINAYMDNVQLPECTKNSEYSYPIFTIVDNNGIAHMVSDIQMSASYERDPNVPLDSEQTPTYALFVKANVFTMDGYIYDLKILYDKAVGYYEASYDRMVAEMPSMAPSAWAQSVYSYDNTYEGDNGLLEYDTSTYSVLGDYVPHDEPRYDMPDSELELYENYDIDDIWTEDKSEYAISPIVNSNYN